jgi:hypothetical protein
MVCPFAIGKAFGLAAATRIGLKYEKLSRNWYHSLAAMARQR